MSRRWPALGIPGIGLYPVPGRALEFGGRRHHTFHPGGIQAPGQAEPGRTCLVDNQHRARQPGHPPDGPGIVGGQALTHNLAGLAVNSAALDAACVDIQTDMGTLIHDWNLQTFQMWLYQSTPRTRLRNRPWTGNPRTSLNPGFQSYVRRPPHLISSRPAGPATLQRPPEAWRRVRRGVGPTCGGPAPRR
jgi:hypothetical protein